MAGILIVGAGPVGLTMAAELTRFGLSVRILDKAAQRTDKSKALVVWSRTLELLDRTGCAAAFVAAGRKGEAVNVFAGGKRIGHISLAEIDSPYPFALNLPQSDTERLLEEHLGGVGVKVERRVEAVGMTHLAEGVDVTLRKLDGAEESLRFDWVIGCGGAHSFVRHALGMSFEGDTLQSDWMLADVHLANFPVPESELAMYWHEEGALAVFPIAPGRFRVVADSGVSQGPHPNEPTLAEVQQIVDRRGPGGVTVSDPLWLSGFRINERKVRDYRVGRVLLAGDAAHVHSPAGGQGMNTGMQDAFNLAWKLALVCNGACSDRLLLDSYSVERSAVGDAVLRDAGRLTSLAILRNHTAQAVRNLVGGLLFGLVPVQHAMAGKLSEISVGYSKTPLNGPQQHGLEGPAPGQRLKPISGQRQPGSGGDPRFVLFARNTNRAMQLCTDHPSLLDPEIRPPLHSDASWLVRADGYVAATARAGSEREIAEYLAKLK
jgi:2-polyprenyl-6-methoxyphenol hydroxylase-like FAD-dependent oxidoreductase